jgi:hypothetical protein
MPILRYFLYVGGALLSLILISSAVMPQMPLPSTLTSASDLPPVRIHSDRKLPERVVFDTSSTVSSAPIPVIASTKAAPTNALSTPQVAAAPVAAPEISPKARVREAFAQLPDDEDISEPKKMSEMALVTVSEPKTISKSLPKRKVAKPRTTQPPVMMVAQQPRFGQATW